MSSIGSWHVAYCHRMDVYCTRTVALHSAPGQLYIATGWVYIAPGQLHDLMSDKYITMNGRTNLQETTAPLLTKMEVKEESQMNRGAVDDLDI